MKNKVFFSLVALILVALVALPLFVACKPALPAKDKIIVGQAVSLSGPLASGNAVVSTPYYDLWAKDVNAAGGIYVKEYGKKLPVELRIIDDKSDVGTMTRLLEELMVQEKVDFILPPWSTAMLFAAAPIANKYNYILVGGAGGASSLENLNLPYFFQSLNFVKTQIPALADILVELGVKKAAILYIEDLHGTEYSSAAAPAFESKGIEVVMNKSYPFLLKDASPLLQEAQSLGADAFIGFSYPEDSILITGTAIAMGSNFKTFFLSVCPAFTFYKTDVFGPAVEGVMGGGAWNEKSNASAKAFSEHYTQVTGQRMGNYWGSIYFYSAMQHFVQAVEEAGTLNQAAIRKVMAAKTYPTALGDYWYDEKQLSANHPGEIGQWQGDVFEVIDPGAKRTAPPISKPDWPKQ